MHFLIFIVFFTRMCAHHQRPKALRAFASNPRDGLCLDLDSSNLTMVIALSFTVLVAAVNFRGMGEA